MSKVLAIALLLWTASSTAIAQCSDAEKRKLEEFDRAWGEATRRGDRAFLQNVFVDDFVDTNISTNLNKAQTIENAVKQAERNRSNPNAPQVAYDQYIISCTPNSAVITHRNVATTKSAEGKEDVQYSRSVHFLEKRGGRWQIVGNATHQLTDSGVLQYMVREWDSAIRNRDAAWLGRNLADDFSGVVSAGGSFDRAGYIDYFNKIALESTDRSDATVRVDGNTAVVTDSVHIKGRDEQGKPFERNVRVTRVFVKRDGRWVGWASHATTMPS